MTLLAGILSSLLAAAGFGDLLSVLVRITMIAAAGLVLGFLLRRASAAKRHLAAMATLVALLSFPAAKVFLPVLSLPILPAERAHAVATRIESADPSIVMVNTPNPFVADEPRLSEDRKVSMAPVSSARLIPGYVILVSFAVSMVLFLQLLISFIAAAVTAGRARRIDDAELRAELASACEQLGVTRRVDLRESDSVTVPVVWGLARPVLLLPAEARTWSREQLRVVFLHEVAHVARYDCLGLLLTRVATSVFWFHPFVWSLARTARRECERCCDDLVLASGERATDYASHLLSIVRSIARRDALADVAPALAQRSNLEGRLVSILRAGQRRDGISRVGLVAAIGLAALLIVATTAVRVVAAPAPANDAPRPAVIATNDAPQNVLLASSDALNALDGAIRARRLDFATSGSDVESKCANSDDDALQAAAQSEVDEQPDVNEDNDLQEPVDVQVQTSVQNQVDLQEKIDINVKELTELGEKAQVIQAAAAAAAAAAITPPRAYWVSGTKIKNKAGKVSADQEQSGIELMRAGQYARAISAFEQEIRETGSVNSMYNLACAYSLRGDKARAFDALENAVENGFSNSQHMTQDDDLKLIQGDPRFYKLVRLSQDLQLFGGNQFGRGFNDESDWRKALPRLERVTREHPRIGRAWSNLGFARLESGDAKGSAGAYQRALDLGYEKPTTLYNLACAASRSGDIDGAFTYLDRADKAGFELGTHAGSDTDLDALRGDPRYDALMERWDSKMAKEHREKQKEEDKDKTY